MKWFLKNIFVLAFILFSSFYISGKESKPVMNKGHLYFRMASLALDCINYGDSLPQEKDAEIKEALKRGKKIQKSDSAGIYLYNLLDLSKCYFIDKNYKKSYNRSGNLMPKYDSNDTAFYHVMHWDTPTWNVFHELSALRLGKIPFSITIVSDASPNREIVLVKNILKEIPMVLDFDVYKKYLSYLIHYDNSNYEVSHLLFRALAANQIDLANHLYGMLDFQADSVRSNLFNAALYGYTINNGIVNLQFDFPTSINPEIVRVSNIGANQCKRFATDLCSNTGIWLKEVFIPYVKSIFGDNSMELLWLIAQNKSSLFTYDSESFLDKISACQSLSDSIGVSQNIIKQMSAFNNKYDYKSAIDFGLTNKHLILDEHLIDYFNILGSTYSRIGQYNEAVHSFQYAIDLRNNGEYRPSPVFFLVPTCEQLRTNLAYSLSNAGRYEEAISALDYEMAKKNENTLFNFISVGNEISHLDDLGRIFTYVDLDKASQYFHQSERLIELNNYSLLPTNKIWHYLSWSFTQSRNSKFKRSLIAKAEQAFAENFISKKPWNVEPVVEGEIYCALGKYYYSIFDYEKASTYYSHAYSAYKELYPEDRRKTELILWDCLNRIALRNTKGVKNILESQLAMQDSLLGANHYDCHQTVKGLLKLAIAENNYDLASQYYPRFKSMDGVFGREQFNYGNQLIESSILSLLGNHKDAYEVADLVDLAECEPSVGLQALELKQLLSENFPIRIRTSELQSINNSAKILSARLFTEVSGQDRVEWAHQLSNLRSGFIVSANTADQIDNALDFSLFTKGLLFRTNKYVIDRIARTRNGQSFLQELSILNDSINHFVAANDTIKIREFRRRYDEQERDIISQFLTPEVMLTGLQTGKQDVFNSIGKNSIAVDFVRYSRNDSICYGAFVFAENIPTEFIQLFSENELYGLITDESGRRTYEAFDGKYSNAELYNLIWGKLVPYFSRYSDLYFSTDGEIAQIGIEYLTDYHGNNIGSSIKLHRVFHLADVTPDVVAGKDILCMGVANHDFPISSNGDDVNRGLWCNLNCDKEILDIKNTYKKRRGHQLFLIDDDVTEPLVQTLSNNPSSIIHVSTHGFYYSADRLRSYAQSINCPDHFLAIRSLQSGKSTLSGLVLRKGNEYRKLPTLPMGYDDIWTSDEIERFTFPKLQLTVLSACQTGLGESNSEGVWGLQRAFRIAGTQKLICALDFVSDKRTREFMGVFYKRLSKGIPIYESFHAARNHLFKHHRDDPRMWSAFILIE